MNEQNIVIEEKDFPTIFHSLINETRWILKALPPVRTYVIKKSYKRIENNRTKKYNDHIFDLNDIKLAEEALRKLTPLKLWECGGEFSPAMQRKNPNLQIAENIYMCLFAGPMADLV